MLHVCRSQYWKIQVHMYWYMCLLPMNLHFLVSSFFKPRKRQKCAPLWLSPCYVFGVLTYDGFFFFWDIILLYLELLMLPLICLSSWHDFITFYLVSVAVYVRNSCYWCKIVMKLTVPTWKCQTKATLRCFKKKKICCCWIILPIVKHSALGTCSYI